MSTESATTPVCPKCGCPARVALVRKAQVRCVLEVDGALGKVLSASRDAEIAGYECGGGHTWPRTTSASDK